MDRRQQKTRTAIFEAFSKLLSRKSYNKITVQEIIDCANIGRSTFYAHFETKDELLKELCSDLFEHVFSKSLITERTHDFSATASTPDAIITHIFYHLRDNHQNIITILTEQCENLFCQFFQQYFNGLLPTFPALSNKTQLNLPPQELLVNHISGSFINLIRWWVKNNLEQSPEELTLYFNALVTPVIAQYTSKN